MFCLNCWKFNIIKALQDKFFLAINKTDIYIQGLRMLIFCDLFCKHLLFISYIKCNLVKIV